MDEKLKRKKQVADHLTALLAFIRFVDKDILTTRQERRQFWRDFISHPRSREIATSLLIDKIEKMESQKISIKEKNLDETSNKNSSQKD